MKKFILLSLLIAAFVFSCAETETGGNDPTNNNITPEAEENGGDGGTFDDNALSFPDLPDIDFEGYNFRVINTVGQGHLLSTLFVEEETGSPLDDAIFRRNRRMENRFGFNLVHIDVSSPETARDRARTIIQSGSDEFDLAMMEPEQAISLAQNGMLEMIDDIPYIDLSQPWWDQDMNKDFSIGNMVLFTVGDFSFNQYSVTMGILFNKELHTALQLEDPYQLVRDGVWTMEAFARLARMGQLDLNGDSVFDQYDQWGFVAPYHVYTPAFIVGMGETHIVKDEADLPVLNINSQGFIERYYVLFDIMNEGWLFDPWLTGIGEPEDMFLNNQTLFWSDLLNWAIKLRAMDNDFGILPMPKLNETQPDYISEGAYPHVMTVPVTTAELDRTGIILEALNAESRLTTLDVYLDTMLVNQVLGRDEESGEMLGIIFSNRFYDMGKLFWRDHTTAPIAGAMSRGNRDIVSLVERMQERAESAIERTIASFLE